MRRLLIISAIALAAGAAPLLVAAPLAAQRLGKPVARPKLREVPDTNDAQAYFDAGVKLYREDPAVAADAFYWAARINPSWGDPLYGRRVALLTQKRNLMQAIMTGNRRSRPELLALDTLQARALILNPFLFRRLDRQMFLNYLTDGDRQAQADYAYEINVWLLRQGPEMRGWYAYSQGQFDRALQLYGEAMERTDDKAYLHLERGRILGMRNDVDGAVAEFQFALDELRAKDEKKLVVYYDSKAMAEFSIATLLEGAGQVQRARDAYGRALQEDLAYYPAHMRLGLLALSQADTTAALSELALAAEIAPNEPFVRYMNGWVLSVARHHAEAIVELKKAVELEPYYALPSLMLGTVYERLDKAPEALDSYERFLRTASARDPQREFATGRLEDIREFLKAPKSQ
jgi:tetratricopeptide (TPR) repeat protein